jgi:hypothetical protein
VRVSSSRKELQLVAEGEATCVVLVPACPLVKLARIPAPFRDMLQRCIAAGTEAAAVARAPSSLSDQVPT